MLPNATPGLASLFKPHLTTLGEISPFPSHLEHQLSTNAKCLGVGSNCKGLYGNWLLSWPNIFSSYSFSSINTNREPLSCIRITTLEFLSSLSAACSFWERLSLACLMFSGLIRSRHTLAKNSPSSGYLDVGGFHFLSFGTWGRWQGTVKLSSGLLSTKKAAVRSRALNISKSSCTLCQLMSLGVEQNDGPFLSNLTRSACMDVMMGASHYCQNKIMLKATKNIRNYLKDIGMVSLRLWKFHWCTKI